MKRFILSVLAAWFLILSEQSVHAQDETPKKRREPLVIDQPTVEQSSAEEDCERQRRDREKIRAQGLPVAPFDPSSNCQDLAAPQNQEPPILRVKDGPIMLETVIPQNDNRVKRIKRNTAGVEPPPLK
jgi:hypothetical protein